MCVVFIHKSTFIRLYWDAFHIVWRFQNEDFFICEVQGGV
jgi:hypothetical protein